ncbi:hypothetical protein [Pontibacter roseus]|uniref:hypothetical protein n=1 Tax=Pontibacter roseus TaxID=336989 RepID=UPI000377BA6B|nr:hypothetical protein [Pontibacter roseus]
MDIFRIFALLSAFSILVPLATSSLRLKSSDTLVRVIFTYAFIILLVEAGGLYTRELGQNNVWLSHLYVPLEYMLLSLAMALGFRNKTIRQGIYLSIALVLVFAIANVVLWQPLDKMNSHVRALSSTLMSLQALLYLYKAFMDVTNVKLLRDPFFLLSIGILIYFVGTVFLFAFLEDMIRDSMQMARYFWSSINSSCTIAFNLILALVAWKAPSR